jgi:hypothetical protein
MVARGGERLQDAGRVAIANGVDRDDRPHRYPDLGRKGVEGKPPLRGDDRDAGAGWTFDRLARCLDGAEQLGVLIGAVDAAMPLHLVQGQRLYSRRREALNAIPHRKNLELLDGVERTVRVVSPEALIQKSRHSIIVRDREVPNEVMGLGILSDRVRQLPVSCAVHVGYLLV